MNAVTDGRCVRGCCFPIYDVVGVVLIFECIELGKKELAVTSGDIPCGDV